MTYVVSTPPATEPLTVSEVMAHLRLDESNQEPPPSAITLTVGSAGSVTNGAHRYLATFVTADGETQAGTASNSITVSGTQVGITNIPIGGSTVIARKIYRTLAGGSTYYLLATIADNTTTSYTDNLADGSLGVQAPTINTTLDSLVGTFIKAARQQAEQRLGRYLITQTIDAYFDSFPTSGDISICLPPLSSIMSISYFDKNGVEQTLASNLYVVDASSIPARVAPIYSTVWPVIQERNNAVKIRFVAGYGMASSVPNCIKTWMMFQVNAMWETRTQFTISTGRAALTQIPSEYIDAMLDPEVVFGRF